MVECMAKCQPGDAMKITSQGTHQLKWVGCYAPFGALGYWATLFFAEVNSVLWPNSSLCSAGTDLGSSLRMMEKKGDLHTGTGCPQPKQHTGAQTARE